MEETFSRQLLQSQIEVQEETMTLLGQELHDNICQQMSSTKLMAGYARRKPEAATRALEEIEEQLGQTIHDIRELTRAIDKDWLAQFDLIANLQTEIARINAIGSLNITMDTDKQLPLGNDKQLLLFRIIQEAIQNAIRHSGASNIKIIVTYNDEKLDVNINDNGQGFNIKSNTGLGMRNMRDRAGLLKGKIEWQSDSLGSAVIVQIPIDLI